MQVKAFLFGGWPMADILKEDGVDDIIQPKHDQRARKYFFK